MSEDGGGQGDGVGDVRGRMAATKKRLQSPITSYTHLLDLLLAPLELLQVLPPSAMHHKHAKWPEDSDEDRRRALANTAWIADVQVLLLERVLFDWQDSIDEEQLLSLCLAWFVPTHGPLPAIGSVLLATLTTLTSVLPSLSKQSTTPASPQTARLVNYILPFFATNFSLRAVVESLQVHQPQGKRDIMWSSAVRQLVSLPERVANATEGSGPHELERGSFVTWVARQLEELVHTPLPATCPATLLTKLLRSGYLEETTAEWEEPRNIWPTVIRCSLNREDASLQPAWSRAFALLPRSARTSIGLSLAAFVDRYSLRRGRNYSLLSGDELLRPGAEGSRFLSKEAWQTVLLLSAVVRPLFYALDSNGEAASDNDDDDDEKAIVSEMLNPSATGYWSPLMARLLVHLLPAKDLEKDLSHVLDQWSSPSRIRTAMWEQEEYLTVVVLLIVARLPSTSTARLCTNADFIKGVSSHLEHLSAKVRRIGMLVAETVSTGLAFSRAIWDGKGEGREEARVLRSMFHGWPSRDMVADSRDAALRSAAFHLTASEDVVADTAIEKAPYATPRNRPRTRTLPVRRSAAPRKRPLIVSLGGSEKPENEDERVQVQAASLPSLSNIAGTSTTQAYVSEGEESSSSEGESSDDDEKRTPATDAEQKPEFGLGMPAKQKRSAPVYLHELAPLFRESEREANKLALRHAEALVRKKAGWGGEVDESAVDLSIAILAMQNNYGFKQFEERKKAVLTALVAASPAIVAPCLAEQYFVQQYSIAQRITLLNSLAFGAREVSGSSKGAASLEMKTLADELAHLAIARARVEGEKRVNPPSSLQLQGNNPPRSLDAGVATTAPTGSSYLNLAGPSFVFPLVNRFWAHLDHASVTRGSRYQGSGSTILLSPFLVAAFLDTLAVLCYCAQNAADFQNSLLPEVISLTLSLTNTALVRRGTAGPSGTAGTAEDHEGGGPAAVLGASANLLLLLLDAAWQLDAGRNLLQRHGEQVAEVQAWAGALFESVEGHNALDRSARSSAAILLRINEMRAR